MPNYRRDRTPGGTWFFTACLRDRTSALLVEEIELLRDAVRQTKSKMPFDSVAWVVMPDHLHAIWTLPEGDNDYPNRWKSIKGRFSRRLPDREGWRRRAVRPREKGIWQNRYWEHRIRGIEDLRTHLRYCYLNPVKHGLVPRAESWPYSSLHRDLQAGRISPGDLLP